MESSPEVGVCLKKIASQAAAVAGSGGLARGPKQPTLNQLYCPVQLSLYLHWWRFVWLAASELQSRWTLDLGGVSGSSSLLGLGSGLDPDLPYGMLSILPPSLVPRRQFSSLISLLTPLLLPFISPCRPLAYLYSLHYICMLH